ncbi:hypothetical protein [Streptomyces abikoensis]|uniref:Uncharacterized protein n=1 Tax=Streptomyces abikoensis TaxID=97398 RepID=A0ABW7TD47_9ACTN
MEQRELMEIEHALRVGAWVPTGEERQLGAAFFTRRDRVDSEAGQYPAGMPLDKHHGALLTQLVTARARLAQELTEDVLPLWQAQLAGSPMLRLVKDLTAAAGSLEPYANRLLTAWATSRPADPDPDLIEQEARRLETSLEEAEEYLRYWGAVFWEKDHLSDADRAEVMDTLNDIGTVGSVAYAAFSERLDH